MLLYVLIDNHDYYGSGEAELFIYSTKKEALIHLFGEKFDDDDEYWIEEFGKSCKEVSDVEFYENRIKNYTNGDGESMKSIFEIDTKTKKAKLIV